MTIEVASIIIEELIDAGSERKRNRSPDERSDIRGWLVPHVAALMRATCYLLISAPVSFHLVLRHIHDHARRQIKPRRDGLQLHVFGVVGVGAVAAQAKTLDHGGRGLQRSEGGVGAA